MALLAHSVVSVDPVPDEPPEEPWVAVVVELDPPLDALWPAVSLDGPVEPAPVDVEPAVDEVAVEPHAGAPLDDAGAEESEEVAGAVVAEEPVAAVVLGPVLDAPLDEPFAAVLDEVPAALPADVAALEPAQAVDTEPVDAGTVVAVELIERWPPSLFFAVRVGSTAP